MTVMVASLPLVAQVRWQHFPSPTGAYTVDLPSVTESGNTMVRTSDGFVDAHLVKFKNGPEEMLVFDAALRTDSDRTTFMNAAREDFSPGGSVTSETESQIGPYRAKRVIGSKGENHMEVIAVVTDRHGWLLWFQSADYLQQSVDQPLFVDSFHFYDNGQDCHLSLYMQTLGNGVTGSCTRAALR